ncbi:probable serine/threonine-protein kinase At1g09600 [Alnus glutinosa]|uniref:probable serine/threonine-protein kinase At1g09600 n=1 Tax=Alnus glutinosa TaxID=3517 RepID=UPI002D766A09|nr:probable serine/threonine-protein kinase At1g09600 [Alnus glutinosa]
MQELEGQNWLRFGLPQFLRPFPSPISGTEYRKKSKLSHATIFKPQHPYKCTVAETFKDFPDPALSLLDVLLAVEPRGCGTASSALQSEGRVQI